MQGYVVGVRGSKVFCLHYLAMNTVNVPQVLELGFGVAVCGSNALATRLQRACAFDQPRSASPLSAAPCDCLQRPATARGCCPKRQCAAPNAIVRARLPPLPRWS